MTEPTRRFADSIRIFDAKDASGLASDLFRESFNAPFPVPRENAGLSIRTPPENWRQYVAIYHWPDGTEETVGFCNWIKYGDVYLQGGMCVSKTFYRRMPRDQFKECNAQGGVAQIMMRMAADELQDCAAWFGHRGDKRMLDVDLRAGYVTTRHKHLIVKWFANPPQAERAALIDSIARIGHSFLPLVLDRDLK